MKPYYEHAGIKIFHGDCLEIMPTLPASSVDLVLCDLPYGTTACKWDTIIPFEPLWEQYRRICKGAIALTASQPFTTILISSNLKNFKHCWVWNKGKAGNFAIAKYGPMRVTEDIVIFCNGAKLPYTPLMEDAEPKNKRPRNIGYAQSSESTIGRMGPGATFKFSGNENQRYPKNLININITEGECNQVNRVHPTQKPVALMEYMIRTYTNEGTIVLDNCMGSGTTGVACVNTGRSFIGIEIEERYCEIAAKRIQEVFDFAEVQA